MCDLLITRITPYPPTAAGGNGRVLITYTSSAGGFVNADATNQTTGGIYSANAFDAFSGGKGTIYEVPPGPYSLLLHQADSPECQATADFEIPTYAPVAGCTDEYADTYDPDATQDDGSCSYSPKWRSAWGRTGMAVPVAALAGQTLGYIAAELRVGFRPGHPLADVRPLGVPISLRATIGPDGYAVFRLGPYLQPLLGVADGAGGYELDLNSPTAFTSDLYVGYELRRADDDTLLEHGYALNSAVPDEALVPGRLSPFAALPLWPGFDDYRVPLLSSFNLGKYGELLEEAALHLGPTTTMTCPSNPLPVAWLAPGGGYGYWVFQGKTQLTDVVEDGQVFQREGQRRYSERGESRRRYEARSGLFKGVGLAEGLATLWRSPQVWLKPTPDSEWVPVSIASGDFPVRRLGALRNEVSVTFVEAMSFAVQGQ